MDYASSILGFLPGGRRSTGISQLLDKLEAYLPPAQVERVREAYDFGAEKHQGQKRVSGEPYITHPVAVADILADLRLDADTLVAAILHDVIEDTPTAKAEIASIFGQVVAELVDGVSKLDQIQFKNRQEAQAESFRKMLLAMVRDIRVIMVKLADRMHNMRTLGVMPPVKRRRIARETLEIYAPIAERLGLYAVKLELEDLGFRALYPYRYKVLERELKRARGNQKEFIGKIAETFKAALKKARDRRRAWRAARSTCTASTRRCRTSTSRSTRWSMCTAFASSSTASTPATARSGLVHSVYKPMPGRFKDYIAIPRVNGYQSLHTTLFGPNGVPIEVQIRSEQMHRVAESGIAAHWKYKSGGDAFGGIEHDRAREWLASLVQIQEGGSSEEFLESVKVDLFPDKVYVFTPKGKILRLPTGATAVDFAYAIHTDVGNRCVAAKVDRRLVPLRTPLRNGQTVEIITAKGATPNPSWSSFLVTAKARAAIRQYLKNLKRGEALGARPAPARARARGAFAQPEEDSRGGHRRGGQRAQPARMPTSCTRKSGLGERLAPLVARHLQPARRRRASASQRRPVDDRGHRRTAWSPTRAAAFPSRTIPSWPTSRAGRGVMIHRQNCGNLAEYRKQPEKWLSVAWEATRRAPVQLARSSSTSTTGWACWRRWRRASRAPKPTSIRCRWKSAT